MPLLKPISPLVRSRGGFGRALAWPLLGAASIACSNAADGPLGTGGAGGLGGGGTAGASAVAGTSGGGTSGQSYSGAGGQSGGGGGSAGTSATIEPSFNTLKSVIQMSCFGGLCHDLPENPLQLSVNEKLYATLTTHMTDGCGPLLKSGAPQESALIKLLKGPCGGIDRMPYGKCFEDADEGCVGPEYIAALEQWIQNGAPQ